jgi:hypothetical protein
MTTKSNGPPPQKFPNPDPIVSILGKISELESAFFWVGSKRRREGDGIGILGNQQ